MNCECGCGQEVNLGSRYICGHYWKGKKRDSKTIEIMANSLKEKWQDPQYRIIQINSHKGQKPWNTGKHRSEETKRKLSEAIKKNPNRYWLGKTHSEETKRKISRVQLGKKLSSDQKLKISLAISGNKHYNWQGGISCEPYCDAWTDKEYKEDIKNRDNYQCQNHNCRKNSQILTIHHIDYNKKNCHPNNLITLCNSCNCRANFNRGYWKQFYQNTIRSWPKN